MAEKDGTWTDVALSEGGDLKEAPKADEIRASVENQDIAEKDEGEPEQGKRVQKRIDKLIKRAKTAEEGWQSERQARLQLEEELAAAKLAGQKAKVDSASPIKAALADKIALLETALEDAYSAADPKALAKAVKDLGEAQFEYKALDAWERENRVPDEKPKAEKLAPRSVEREMPEAAKDWFAKNPWFGFSRAHDRVASNVAQTISQELIAEGWDAEDSDFYDEVDKRLKSELPRLNEEDERPRNPVARTSRVPATGLRPGRVRLSEEEVDTARRLGVSLNDYAQQKVEVENAGRGRYVTIKVSK